MRRLLLGGLLMLAGVVASCTSNRSSVWAEESCWYQDGVAVDESLVDVVYFAATEVVSSAGLMAELSPAEKEVMDREFRFVRGAMFPDSLNFFAPYYHQVTFEGLGDPAVGVMIEKACDECWTAFSYYWKALNRGKRPYVLAGFSQGADMVKGILRRMNAAQYRSMVAAYVIGSEVDSTDLAYRYIVPASGEFDRGVTISFNSVVDPSCKWELICQDPAACINPVSWTTDAKPAPWADGDIELSVAVDPSSSLVIVTGYGDELPVAPFEEPWPKGCLHRQDLILYTSSIARNVLNRSYYYER